jgi:hypothetical protein
VQECCTTGHWGVAETTESLFRSWSNYALANGEKPGTTKWLSQALQRQGFYLVKDTPGHRNKRGFMGIKVMIWTGEAAR